MAAIEEAWPDGEVGMLFDSEESWFWDLQLKLARAFRRLEGARLLYEHEADETQVWEHSYGDDDLPPDSEPSRSYHLFFISPADDAFTFESETETEADAEFDEYEGDPDFDGDLETVTVQGKGHTGWAVAVSLIAPLAAITLNDYSLFEDGSESAPDIESYAEDDEGNRIDPEEHFRKCHGERLFQRLEALRNRIAGILEKQGVTVLPETEWRKPVPWLRSDGDALVGDSVGQHIRVLDAFFFRSI